MSTLTKNQKTLYKNLLKVVEENENFYFVDQTTAMQTKVRIFSYHLGSYSDWLKPGALECRGIMFQMEEETPVKLLSRPMEKFFNYAEVKAWEKLKDAPALIGDTVIDVMVKEDGSLISTFDDSGYLGLKSKASIQSEQAMDASAFLFSHPELRERLYALVKDGYTVNMEWVSTKNRIVVGYAEPSLIILNVRDNDTGEYVPYKTLFNDLVLRRYLVERTAVEISGLDGISSFAEYAYSLEGFEGYVVQTNKGFVKLKTNWYVNLHRTKDSINNNKDLFLNIVDNTVDDLKQLFIDDILALKKIDAFEVLFIDSLNRLLKLAFKQVEDNKGKSRKDYAIALSSDLTTEGRIIFGPLMNYFSSSDKEKLVADIQGMMVKNYADFIPDEYK